MFNTILGVPLGYIIYYAFRLTGNYGAAIIIFAFAARVILFPVSAAAHKNSLRLLQIWPALQRIKQRYAGDKSQLNEAQYELFQKEKYSPLIGIVPLFVQLILIIGILQVMYHPMQHLRLETETDLHFFGLNLLATPSFANPSPLLLVPLLSGVAALAFCLVQNAISPGALSQSKNTNLGLTLFTVGLSLYFALVMPAGVGVYWAAGNLAGIGVALVLNIMYNPQKLAGEALQLLKATQKTPVQLREERQRNRELNAWSKSDAARFGAAEKQLVFYALSGGQYRYYKNIIDYLIAHSDATIHYLTNDPNDPVLNQETPRIVPYYARERKTVFLMLYLNADILVTTVPDLQCFQIKRSVKRDDIEYIYIPHTVGSVHVTLREAFCDYFDTVFCVGPHQVTEIRRREEYAELPKKNLVKAGYGLYDTLAHSYEQMFSDKQRESSPKRKILIAPSWQDDNILDICVEPIIDSLQGHGYEITLRPHPQYIKLYPERLKALQERYAHNEDIVFGLDISNNESVFMADILITDWSNISFEFAYCTLKPCIFINTPMKVMNPHYESLGVENVDVSLRDRIGVSIETDKVCALHEVVADLLENLNEYKAQILQVREQYLYHPGRNGEAGGKYIIQQLQTRSAI
jgi:YidC/Oxa1 family membrane protein insertase